MRHAINQYVYLAYLTLHFPLHQVLTYSMLDNNCVTCNFYECKVCDDGPVCI